MLKPELRHTQNDVSVTDFHLAMTEKWKNKAGEEKSETTWVKVVCWGKLAESITQVIDKGDLVLVEGKITNREFEKDGIVRKITEIEANNVLKMESARRNSEEYKQIETTEDSAE